MTKHICPVCGKHEFDGIGSFDICPVCDWCDDCVQEDEPDLAGCGNKLSLNDYKKKYKESLSD